MLNLFFDIFEQITSTMKKKFLLITKSINIVFVFSFYFVVIFVSFLFKFFVKQIMQNKFSNRVIEFLFDFHY